MLVACTGMYRAGSTLQYNLARVLAEATARGRAEGFYDRKQFPRMRRRFESWGCDDSIHVIKTHHTPPQSAEMIDAGHLRICYIYRDLRDVAASLKRKFRSHGSRLVHLTDDAVETCEQIQALPSVLVQRYEDSFENVPTMAREMADFLELDADEEVISFAVQECSIDNASRIAQKVQTSPKARVMRVLQALGIRRFAQDRRFLLHSEHVSATSGQNGTWQAELTEEEALAITERHGAWLRERGYLE
jgi:Sulfotransferase domain